MRKVYYMYNPQTQTYDRIYPTVRQRALSILRRLFIGMGLVMVQVQEVMVVMEPLVLVEEVVVVQRLSERGRTGKVEWIVRKSDGKNMVLTAKDSTDCERPTLVEALLVKTTLLAHGLILPVSKHLGTGETVAA